MESQWIPNPISQYYIAYFDILGYKEFFMENPENELQFLNAIHDAVSNVKNMLYSYNNSALMELVADVNIKIKIFSDNFLLCMAVGTDKDEQIRLLSFMAVVSKIQRDFIRHYGLFVRGGLTEDKLSFNDNYAFGKGLIDVVEMEETTTQPRIAVSNKILDIYSKDKLYSQEEVYKAVLIENRYKNGEHIVEEDHEFYKKILRLVNQEFFIRKICPALFYMSDDGVICLSYLYCIDITAFISSDMLQQVLEMLKQYAPEDYDRMPKEFLNIELILKTHKEVIESKLMKYSNYTKIDTNDIKRFNIQESILRKYVWVMVYHNYMCSLYGKHEYYIHTCANCEKRYMKLVIFVTDEKGEIKKE